MAEVSGGRARGKAGLMVWRCPWATEEWRCRLRDTRKIGKSGEPWCIWYVTNCFSSIIFVRPCVLSDRPTVLWWLSHGEGWDAVTWCGLVNVKTAQLLKINSQMSSIRVYYWTHICIWILYPSIVDWESHGILLFLLLLLVSFFSHSLLLHFNSKNKMCWWHVHLNIYLHWRSVSHIIHFLGSYPTM